MLVSVPQSDGEIKISFDGDPAVTYEVTDGRVEVDAVHLNAFLATVPGAGPVSDPAPAPAPAPTPAAPPAEAASGS